MVFNAIWPKNCNLSKRISTQCDLTEERGELKLVTISANTKDKVEK
jgi:hypothetical protein